MEQLARVVWRRLDTIRSDDEEQEDVPEGLGDLKVMVELLAAGNISEAALVVSNHDSVLNRVGERCEVGPPSQTQGKEESDSEIQSSDCLVPFGL